MDDSDPSCGGVFQLSCNEEWNEEWHHTIIGDHLDQKWLSRKVSWHFLYQYLTAQQRSFITGHWDFHVPRRLFRKHLEQGTLDDVKMMAESHSNALCFFEWSGRSFLAHPSGECLNELVIEEVQRSLTPDNIKATFKTMLRYDFKSPIVKIRASCVAFTSVAQEPLIAVQLAVPEVAIFRFDQRGTNVLRDGQNAEVYISLVEHLRFKAHVKSFCWDERPSTGRDTQSLVILNVDGTLSLWTGNDKSRILRSDSAAKDVCPPYIFSRADQSVSSITKMTGVGEAEVEDNQLPNYGNRLCFSGHPSSVLVMTADAVDLVDFSKSAATQTKLLRIYKPMTTEEGLLLRQKKQFDNILAERQAFFERYFDVEKQAKRTAAAKAAVKKDEGDSSGIQVKSESGDSRVKKESNADGTTVKQEKKPRVKRTGRQNDAGDDGEDDEGFHSTAQIRLAMQEHGFDGAHDPIFRFYTPMMAVFEPEYDAMRADGPTLRLAQHEMLRDIASHPTRPYLFAILTTMRICLFDERSPQEPVIQWRHHLVRTRRSLFERRILFSPECPQTIQFVVPPPHLQELDSLDGKFFIIASNSLHSEVFTLDHGPSASVDPDFEKMAETMDHNEPLPTEKELKRQVDAELLKLMDSIVRDVTRPELARPSYTMPPKLLNFFIPPPSSVRLLGLGQTAFRNPIPTLEQVDYLNVENMRRSMQKDKLNLATTAQVGLWSYDKGAKALSMLMVRCDARGNLFAQILPLMTTESDRDSIRAMSEQDHSSKTAESDSGSESGSRSSASSPANSDSESDSSSSDSRASLPRPNQEDIDSSTESSSDDSSASDNEGSVARRFSLNQPHSSMTGARRLVDKRHRLTERNEATADVMDIDAGYLASATFDFRPPLVPHYKFAPDLENAHVAKLKQGDKAIYERLSSWAKTGNQHDRLLLRSVRQRLNPYTGELEPPHPAFDDPANAEAPNSFGTTVAGDVEYEVDSDYRTDSPASASDSGSENPDKPAKVRPGKRQAGDQPPIPRAKRAKTMQPIAPDTVHLCQSQINFVYEHLPQILAADTPTIDEIEPIDLMGAFDVVFPDLNSAIRIFGRAKAFILLPFRGLRSTADIYRQLSANHAIHPYYFPIAFLRATLSHLVSTGSLDYVSIRGTHEGTMLYSRSSDKSDAALEARRHELMQSDALCHFMTIYDELDLFAVCMEGEEDVHAQYILGHTKTPFWKPVPANKDATTVSAASSRFDRAPYPPPAPELVRPTEDASMEMEPLMATQSLALTQSGFFSSQVPRYASILPSQLSRESSFVASLPPHLAPMLTNPALARASSSLFSSQLQFSAAQPSSTSMNLDQSTGPLDTSVVEPTQEMDGLASQRTYTPFVGANSVTDRKKTQAELDLLMSQGLNKTTDVDAQQSQIWEMLQTQQMQDAADLEYQLEREEAEAKMQEMERKKLKAEASIEKTNAPGTKPQLMAVLLKKWEDAYSNPDHLASVAKARALLRTDSQNAPAASHKR